MDEIESSVERGYLSPIQYQIVHTRLYQKSTYNELILQFGLSGRTALTHALARTSGLDFWEPKMKGQGKKYLSKYDSDIFFGIIGGASDDANCIPAMYGISLAHYIKNKDIQELTFY